MNTTQAIGRMREVIPRQHKALSTQDSYVFWLRRYIIALRQPLMDERELEKEWPSMRSQLSVAMKGWAMPKNVVPLPVPAITPSNPRPQPSTPKPSTTATAWWSDLPLWRQAV
jgi:hypothetical protein